MMELFITQFSKGPSFCSQRTPSDITVYCIWDHTRCIWSTSRWQIVNVNIYRGRSCVGKGTLYSKTMVPNGTWRMQQDVSWLPQPSASWFLLLTLRRWQLLISEFGMPATIQMQHWTLIILFTCSLASQQTGIKKKMGSSKNVLLKRFDELKKSGMGTGRVEFKSTFNPCDIRQKPFFIDLTISKKCL